MARKSNPWYMTRVASLAEDGYKPPTIARMMKAEALEGGRGDWPSERTVRRIYDAHSRRPESDRVQSAIFHWPEAMAAGNLPWEASRVALELELYMQKKADMQPTIQLVQWYWRVTQANSSLTIADRHYAAALLATWETLESQGRGPFDRRPIEWFVSYSAEERDSYLSDVEDGRIPRLAWVAEMDADTQAILNEHLGGIKDLFSETLTAHGQISELERQELDPELLVGAPSLEVQARVLDFLVQSTPAEDIELGERRA